MLATSSSSSNSGGMSLSAILTSLQQGVQAINNITQAMSSIFPTS